MPTTVGNAFKEFLSETVNLKSDTTSQARTSRDWLIGKIGGFTSDGTFPRLYPEVNIGFGSFARKTKKRPLDDIDYMLGLSADLSTYSTLWDGTIHIHVHQDATNLKALTHDDGERLNSRKVINLFVKKLGEIPQYGAASIKRNGEAACIKPNSYEWNFDIVPCFITQKDENDKTFYLIPDGNGHWKKTDPRKDRDRVTYINQKNDGYVLNAIRIMKYWNRRPTMPSMGSYLLENMILDYYYSNSASEYIDFDVRDLLKYISTAIFNPVYDPKGIQGDLNNLTWNEKAKIMTRAEEDYNRALDAIEQETRLKDVKKSIETWQIIFGTAFPAYG